MMFWRIVNIMLPRLLHGGEAAGLEFVGPAAAVNSTDILLLDECMFYELYIINELEILGKLRIKDGVVKLRHGSPLNQLLRQIRLKNVSKKANPLALLLKSHRGSPLQQLNKKPRRNKRRLTPTTLRKEWNLVSRSTSLANQINLSGKSQLPS